MSEGSDRFVATIATTIIAYFHRVAALEICFSIYFLGDERELTSISTTKCYSFGPKITVTVDVRVTSLTRFIEQMEYIISIHLIFLVLSSNQSTHEKEK